MKKIELEIVALSHSITQTNSYAVVLGEKNGFRRIPIVIGGSEAQAIAVALEKINATRPLTHDLMKNLFMAFDVQLHEVIISHVEAGVFFSTLVCSTQNNTIDIDSRTSDALALAVRFGCPIYTYDSILKEAGILMEDDGNRKTPKTITSESDEHTDLKLLSIEELESLLVEVLEQEDYITAIAIRDEIKNQKKR